MGVAVQLEHAVAFDTDARHAVHLMPDGEHFLMVSGANLVESALHNANEQTFFHGHNDDITCLAVSGSGKLAASGQLGKTPDVIVWDVATRRAVYTLCEHQSGVADVAFSRDERFLVTVGDVNDGKLFVWDMHTGYIVTSSSATPLPTSSMCWGGRVCDRKGRPTALYLLASLGGNGNPVLWHLDPATGALDTVPCSGGTQQRQYTCMEFTQDGAFLVTGSSSGDLSLFQVKNAIRVCTVTACGAGVTSLAVFHDPAPDPGVRKRNLVEAQSGTRLVAGGGDGSVTILCKEEERLEYYVQHRFHVTGAVACMSVRDDDSGFVLGTRDGHLVHALDVSQSSLAEDTVSGVWKSQVVSQYHCGGVLALHCAVGRSDRVASTSRDGSIRVWDTATYRVCNQYRARGGGSRVFAPAVAMTELCVFSGWSDGSIRAYATYDDDKNQQPLWEVAEAHKGGVQALQASPNGKFLASGGREGALRVWDIRSKELVCHIKEHTAAITDLSVHSDNRHALTCSRDRMLCCWDLHAETRVSAHRQSMGGINSLAVVDEHLVLTVGQERRVTYWDLRAPTAVKHIHPAHDGPALCIATGPHSSVFATGGADQVVKVWDMRSSECLFSGTGHSSPVNDVLFAPDGKQLFSAGGRGGADYLHDNEHEPQYKSASGCGELFVWNVYPDSGAPGATEQL